MKTHYLKRITDWIFFSWVVIVHIGAVASLFFFTWPAFWTMVFLWWLSLGVGITMGYHRYFTHNSFKTSKPVAYLLAICGCLAGEGGPMEWAAAHRWHHAYSDQEQDPHSPLKSFFWAHFLWMLARHDDLVIYDSYKRFVPEIAKDKVLVLINKYHYVPMITLGTILFLVGGWPFLLWGMGMRSVIVYHGTWFVNSATHVWGYRSWDTTDQSRNNWWVALWTFGEGWHNNHHGVQKSARHGHKWWELDITYRMIQFLWMLGLATDIHLPVRNTPKPQTVSVTDLDPQKVRAACTPLQSAEAL